MYSTDIIHFDSLNLDSLSCCPICSIKHEMQGLWASHVSIVSCIRKFIGCFTPNALDVRVNRIQICFGKPSGSWKMIILETELPFQERFFGRAVISLWESKTSKNAKGSWDVSSGHFPGQLRGSLLAGRCTIKQLPSSLAWQVLFPSTDSAREVLNGSHQRRDFSELQDCYDTGCDLRRPTEWKKIETKDCDEESFSAFGSLKRLFFGLRLRLPGEEIILT